MNDLRKALDELAASAPVYGDLDRAIEQAAADRRRRRGVAAMLTAAAAAAVIVAWGVVSNHDDAAPDRIAPAGPHTLGPVPVLEDGPITPGRYAFELTYPKHCSPRKDPINCPRGIDPPPPMDIEVTVPEGWIASNELHLIERNTASGFRAPDGAALVLGWTSYYVGLHSDPCLHGEPLQDTEVGPGVDDFVDAVVANDNLDITPPEDVRLGGYRGRFFTLQAPRDFSECDYWQPWEPGFYAQGPSNQWDVWVIDVDGRRVVVVAHYFPGTPGQTKADLRQMVESITFDPQT